MRSRYQPSELRTAKLWWIVSLDFGGRTWRVSQASLSIESTEAGRWLSVSAGLDTAEAQLTAPWMGTAPEQRSISLELSIPELDVGLLLSRNYELDGAPVEVAIWREGDTWEDRLQILRGQITSYEWGAKGEALALEAEGVPAGPINDMAEVFADPQVAARGMRFRPEGAFVDGIASPIVIDGERMAALGGAPVLGG